MAKNKKLEKVMTMNLEDLQNNYLNSINEIKSLKSKLTKCKTNCEEAHNRASKVNSVNLGVVEKNSRLEEEIKRLREIVEPIKNNFFIQSEENKSLRTERRKLLDEISRNASKINEHDVEVENLKLAYKITAEQNDNLKKEIDEFKKKGLELKKISDSQTLEGFLNFHDMLLKFHGLDNEAKNLVLIMIDGLKVMANNAKTN